MQYSNSARLFSGPFILKPNAKARRIKLKSCIYQYGICLDLYGGTICQAYFKNKKPKIATREKQVFLFT
jgi:hypothetical protein